MASVIRVVIAEDSLALSELYHERLSVAPDLEVIGTVRSGREAIAVAGRLNPDILALDIDMPDISGLGILPVIRWCSPTTKVIVLSDHNEEATIVEALELGAKGYIVKSDRTDVVKAIRVVQCGEVWARRRVLARVLDRLVGLASRTFQEDAGGSAPA
ncbi:MAG TPA: response regulator transcription factor [Patescibacteria group bacterium]|nr:response regulator transcription factor [Patescibacteria group bacterium]